MKTTVINTAKELKDFVSKNNNIRTINGVQFNKIYPMLDITNKHASYYDAESQGNEFLYAPFTIEYNA